MFWNSLHPKAAAGVRDWSVLLCSPESENNVFLQASYQNYINIGNVKDFLSNVADCQTNFSELSSQVFYTFDWLLLTHFLVDIFTVSFSEEILVV